MKRSHRTESARSRTCERRTFCRKHRIVVIFTNAESLFSANYVTAFQWIMALLESFHAHSLGTLLVVGV